MIVASDPPRDPIAAVTHADPYPYYAAMVENRPFYFDEPLGFWVASSADAVVAALTSGICRVRPPAEAVPNVLQGGPAGEIFRRLVRTRDDADRQRVKSVLTAGIDAIDLGNVRTTTDKWATALLEQIVEPFEWSRFMPEIAFRVPAYVVASTLGIGDERLEELCSRLDDFVRCLSPFASAEQVDRGNISAEQLLEVFQPLHPAAETIANAIGLLLQSYEATAGLIGNTLLALSRHQGMLEAIVREPEMLARLTEEVLRYDSPVQNTRRFVAERGSIMGETLSEGDRILVVLAAANRDPEANPRAEQFDVSRVDRRLFTFGIGPHACPGKAVASTIAAATVECVIRRGLDLRDLANAVFYRPSANVRIPLFGPHGGSSAVVTCYRQHLDGPRV